MKTILKTTSYTGLALTLLPSIFLFAEMIPLNTSKQLMALGAILWFTTSVFWIQKSNSSL